MDLAAKAGRLEPRTGTAEWDGYEYGQGYAVLALPFDSGHVLGLRVFPENDFAPYVSVWHRPPDGDWSIYVDGPALETACPRYWGPATDSVGLAAIDVAWTDETELRIEVDEPALEWALSVTASRLLRALNRLNAASPLWTWRVGGFLRVREWLARHYLGYGDVDLSFTTASGHEVILVAAENYRIGASSGRLDGRPLGDPTSLPANPTIGGVPLPSAPSLVFGRAYARIQDPDEYRRTRARVAD